MCQPCGDGVKIFPGKGESMYKGPKVGLLCLRNIQEASTLKLLE